MFYRVKINSLAYLSYLYLLLFINTFFSEVVAYITVSMDDPWVKAITTKKPLFLVLLEG